MPKVSVIIPVYNVEEYLRECLDSVVNQTLKDIEIICINDGSTDSSLEILKEYAQKDNRFVILEQENQGAGAARNKGLEVAQGEYLYFLDSDDYIIKECLEELYIKITETNSSICICKQFLKNNENEISIDDESLKIDWLKNKLTFTALNFKKNIFQIASIGIYTKLYEKDFIKKSNIKFQNIKTVNDVYFNYVAILSSKKITYINKPLIIYRLRTSNNLTSKRGKSFKNVILAYEEIYKFMLVKNIFKDFKTSFYKRFSQACWAEVCLSNGKIDFSLLNNQKSEFWKFYKKYSKPYKLKNIQYIFSLHNSIDKQYHVITILGLKFYIRRRQYNEII